MINDLSRFKGEQRDCACSHDGPFPVCLVTRSSIVSIVIREFVGSLGFSPTVLGSFALLENYSGLPFLLIVDLGFFSDMDEATERLMAYRSSNRQVPTIIVSETFSYDDFDCSREAISDVSLMMPLTRERLELALSQAVVNNRRWRSRSGVLVAGDLDLQLGA